MAPGSDDHAVVDDEVVVGEQVQDGVLEDLHVVADAHRSVRVADDLDAGADDRAFADDDVTGDLGGREQDRRSARRSARCRGRRRADPWRSPPVVRSTVIARVRRERQVAAAQTARAGEVVGRRRAHDPRRAVRPRRRRRAASCPAGTSVPSPRNTRSPSRAPGMRIEALPISHRSPTVAPITRQRWPNTVRRPTTVGAAAADHDGVLEHRRAGANGDVLDRIDRTTAPSASRAPRPGRPTDHDRRRATSTVFTR